MATMICLPGFRPYSLQVMQRFLWISTNPFRDVATAIVVIYLSCMPKDSITVPMYVLLSLSTQCMLFHSCCCLVNSAGRYSSVLSLITKYLLFLQVERSLRFAAQQPVGKRVECRGCFVATSGSAEMPLRRRSRRSRTTMRKYGHTTTNLVVYMGKWKMNVASKASN